MEKLRLGRDASSPTSVSVFDETTAVISGVAGRLTKKTLSQSSLADSSMLSVPAVMDRASTSVGRFFPSGRIRRKLLVFFAVKKCVYSGELPACSSVDGRSMVVSRCPPGGSVAERWWLVAGRQNEGRRDPGPRAGVSWRCCTDEDRFTSLLGGSGEGERRPMTGAVELS